MDEKLTESWFDPLFKTEAMRRVFSDPHRLQGMLDFEAALARALAAVGSIPQSAAETIASQCRAEFFDIPALSRASAAAGNSAIPVIVELERLVASKSDEAARYVHIGATSQDAMDTGLMLQVRDALMLIDDCIERLAAELAILAGEYKNTLTVGRTWLQHAAPTTLGLKVAGWLSALLRHRERIEQLRPRCLVVQLGGPVGTLAAYGQQASRVVELVANDLKLAPAELPWHAHRDRLSEIAATLGLVVGTLGKIARDIALLSQSEIGEVAEPSALGRGGSSSMPQKQNPVGCAVVLAAATRVPPLVSTMLAAMQQENERGLGGWQAEWETLPEIFELTDGALAAMQRVVSGVRVDVERIIDNLDASQGFLFAEAVAAALTLKIGRAPAQELVKSVCRTAAADGLSFNDAVRANRQITAHLSLSELCRALDASPDVHAAARLVDRLLTAISRPTSPSSAEDN